VVLAEKGSPKDKPSIEKLEKGEGNSELRCDKKDEPIYGSKNC